MNLGVTENVLLQVVNTEWGNFQTSHLPLTEYDHALDAESINPGEQVNSQVIFLLCLVFLCIWADNHKFAPLNFLVGSHRFLRR